MTAIEVEDVLLAAAEVTIEAGAELNRPRVSILAYTGGIMRVPGWGDIVIDLAGLDVSGAVAVLSDHDSTRRGVVGHGRAQVIDGKLMVTGTVSATTEAAREVTESAKGGYPWQASVGTEVLEQRRVAAGETVAVNGRSIKAPAGGFTLVTRGRLREVSIVGIGCDSATSVAIVAAKRQESDMETGTVLEQEVVEQTPQETAETKRVDGIKRICGARHADRRQHARGGAGHRNRRWLLTGVLECGDCGHRL
jgi:hypothetical protein